MPVNRNALIRFKTLDNCFRNRQRRWTLEALVEACSEALYEYEGIEKGVSTRTVQMDIQIMRSDKLGYNAPIVVLERKYYTYDDPGYSITNIPLTNQDLGKLTEVVEILRQFKGFSHFQELSGMVQRLENKIHSAKTKTEPVIDFEKNENLKGLEHIDTLYQAIIQQRAVVLCYQSFRARSANTFSFHPYYLKEYRNRWFVLGTKSKNDQIMNLALDRIITVSESSTPYVKSSDFNLSSYFEHVIGVTVGPNEPPERVVLFADHKTAPYILTKPLHQSQQVVEKSSNGVVFSIDVQLNFELEREVLGFGDRVKVLAPEKFRRRIKDLLEGALDQYQYEFTNASLANINKKIEHKGFAILNYVYGRREINSMRAALYGFQRNNAEEDPHAIRSLLLKIPSLSKLIFNSNLLTILKRIQPGSFLTKAIYFDKSPQSNRYVAWHQDANINVKTKIDVGGFSGWTKKEREFGVQPPEEYLRDTLTLRIHLDDADEQTGALKVVPGSHQKKLTDSEIQVITQNSVPTVCSVACSGVHIMKPLLLHATSRSTNQKHRRVLHLEFNTRELPGGLDWAERLLVPASD